MSSDSSPGRFPKKYLGSVTKSNHTGSQRSSNAKSLTTGSKVSAPKPLNLPSLRHESSKASPDSTSSTSGESDHHPTSIVHTPATINRWGSPLQQQHTTTSGISDSDTKSKDSTSSSSPIVHQSSPSASPAWSTISSATKKATDTTAASTTSTSTTVPSPTCDSKPKNTILSPKKEHVKITVSHHAKPADIPMPFTQASEPSNMSWDEMVSEEMDFNVSVVDEDDNDIKLEDQESSSTSLEDTDGNTSLSENQSLQQQPVSPSDRFTDDYDRSYPSTSKRTSPGSLYNSQPQESYRHQDRYHHHHHHHYNDTYYNNNNNAPTQNGGKWSSERRGSEHSNTSGYRGQRRPSSSSRSATGGGWSNHNDQQRRVSQDRSKPLPSPQLHQHPDTSSITTATATTTLLRRPSTNNNTNSNSNNGLYSTSDDRPPEIVAAQRQAMLSAAEQAKKRREADEAERQAAAARARQKALALAPPPPPPPSTKPLETIPPPSPDNQTSKPTTSTPSITILTHAHEDHLKASNNKAEPTDSRNDAAADTEKDQKTTTATTPVVKRGTIITSTTASTGTHHLFANKQPAPLTQDEKSWEDYVNQIKKPPTTTTSDKDGEEKSTTVSDWSSFAQRLQRSTEEKKVRTMKDSPTKEDSLADQQQQSQPEPESTKEKLDDESTPTSSSDQQQDTSEPKTATVTTIPTQTPVPAPSVPADEETTSTVESHPIKPRRFIRPNTILDKAVYPIFPDTIGRFVLPKPTSLQFMIDPEESDDEIMHTLERHYHHQVDSSHAKQTQSMSLPPLIEPETTTEQVESSSSPSPSSTPLLDDHAPISQQRTTSTSEPAKQLTPTLDDQVPPVSQHTPIEKKKPSTSIPTSYDDTLYPKGLPVPGDSFGSTVSPASITPASIHTTLSNFDIPSGYNKDALPAPHNEHYPLLMYPLHAPPTDLLTMGSDQKGQPGFSVVLLPPGDSHPSSKPVSSHRHGPRRGYNRHRGAGGRGGKHRHPSSNTGSWRPAAATSTPTKADRPTAKTA